MTITPQLMFAGQAAAAVDFWLSVFPAARLVSMERQADGTVRHAGVEIDGQRLYVTDSAISHDFGFTPAISLVVEGSGQAEVTRMFGSLAEDGRVLMPLDAYDFSPWFGWVEDRFGVSWQLSAARTDGG